jgi:hypothetical protein
MRSNLNKRTSDNKQTKTPSTREDGKNDPERKIQTSLARYDASADLKSHGLTDAGTHCAPQDLCFSSLSVRRLSISTEDESVGAVIA